MSSRRGKIAITAHDLRQCRVFVIGREGRQIELKPGHAAIHHLRPGQRVIIEMVGLPGGPADIGQQEEITHGDQ